MNTNYTIIIEANVIIYRFTTPHNATITVGEITYDMDFYVSIKFDKDFSDKLVNLGISWAGIFATESKIVNHNRLISVSLATCTIDNTTGNIVS